MAILDNCLDFNKAITNAKKISKKNIIIFILILILTYQEYYTLMQIRKMIKSTFLDKGMNPLNQLLKVIMFLMQKVGGFQLRLTKLFYFLLI